MTPGMAEDAATSVEDPCNEEGTKNTSDLENGCHTIEADENGWDNSMAMEPQTAQRVLRSVTRNHYSERSKKMKTTPDDSLVDSDNENQLVIDIDCDSANEERMVVEEPQGDDKVQDKKYLLRPKSQLNNGLINWKSFDEVLSISDESSPDKEHAVAKLSETWIQLPKPKKKGKTKREKKKALAKNGKLLRQEYAKDIETVPKEEDVIEVVDSELPHKNCCPVCSQQFMDSHSFTIHIREHNTDKFSHVCTICSKQLCSASSLDRHMYVHSGERPFECQICNLRFTTNGNMNRHKKIHAQEGKAGTKHGAVKRSLDGKAKNGNTQPVQDVKERIGGQADKGQERAFVHDTFMQSRNCCVCDKSFLSPAALQQHMKLHINNPMKCYTCDVVCENYFELQSHPCTRLADNKKSKPNPNKLGFYDLSIMEFSSSKFPLYAKNMCEAEMRNPSSEFFPWECNVCSRAFPSNLTLAKHEDDHNPTRSKKCHTCGTNYLNKKSFSIHQIQHRVIESSLHEKSSSANVEVAESLKEDFMAVLKLCSTKNQPQKEQNSDLKHFNSHDYFIKPFSFPNLQEDSKIECDSKEESKMNPSKKIKCRVSMDNTVGGDNDLATVPSIISLTSKTALPNLRASPVTASPASPLQATAVNTPESPVIESSVNPLFESNVSLDSEMPVSPPDSSNADVKPTGEFKCPKCPESFTSSNDLKEHSKKHAKTTLYRCEFCNYQTVDKSTLKRHMRKHNGEHPFKCSICQFIFTTKANGHRHVKNKHKLTDQAAANAVVYNPNMLEGKQAEGQTKPNGQKKESVCKYCKHDFKYNRVLRHHLRSINNSCSHKPFTCQICKQGFSTKNNCIRHITNYHPDKRSHAKEFTIANNLNDQPENEEENQSKDVSEVENMDVSNQSDFEEEMSDVSMSESSVPSRSMAEMVSAAESLISLQGLFPNTSQDSSFQDFQTCSSQSSISGSPRSSPFNLQPVFAQNLAEEPASDTSEPAMLDLSQPTTSDLQNSTVADIPEAVVSKASETPYSPFVPQQENPLDLSVCALNLSLKSQSYERRARPAYTVVPSTANKRKSTVAQKGKESPGILDDGCDRQPINLSSKPTELGSNSSMAICFVPDILNESINFSTPSIPIVCYPEVSSPINGLISNGTVAIPSPSALFVTSTPTTTDLSSEKGKCQQKDKKFSCDICFKGFTLKSNRERHIKNHHPEHARPPRSRNYIPTLSPSSIQKQNSSTLSDKTRDALRVALIAKSSSTATKSDAGNRAAVAIPFTPITTTFENLGITKNIPENKADVADLASVSDVIDAVNCQPFKEYLDRAQEANNKASEDQESINELNNTEANESTEKKSSYTKSSKSICCTYCKRKFPWKSSLSRHFLTHTGLKPHKCPKCPLSFTTKSNRDRHLYRQHKDCEDVKNMSSKPYHCEICPSSHFSTKGKLKKHYFVKHSQKLNTIPDHDQTIEASPKSPIVISPSPEPESADGVECSSFSDDQSDTFDCHVCSRAFKAQHDLLSHLTKAHPKEFGTPKKENISAFQLTSIKVEPEDIDESEWSLRFPTQPTSGSDQNIDFASPSSSQNSDSPSLDLSSQAQLAQNSSKMLQLCVAAEHLLSSTDEAEETTRPPSRNSSSNENNLILDLLGLRDSDFLEEMLESAVRSQIKKESDT